MLTALFFKERSLQGSEESPSKLRVKPAALGPDELRGPAAPEQQSRGKGRDRSSQRHATAVSLFSLSISAYK